MVAPLTRPVRLENRLGGLRDIPVKPVYRLGSVCI